jgi:Flp pilus assembly protein protease CpaA
MALILCVLTLFISVQDIRLHLITHKSLLLFTAASFALFSPPPFTLLLTSLLALFLITLLTDIGGGDIKLISILILTQGNIWLTPESALFALSLAPVLVLALALRNRAWPTSVPMAPILLAPLAYFYLAI